MNKKLFTLLTFVLIMLSHVACKDTEGPFERAGAKVDEASESVRESVEEAGDEIEDATDNS